MRRAAVDGHTGGHGDPPRDGRGVPRVPAHDRERVPRGRHRRRRSRRWRTVFEPERSLAVFDGSAMVATAAIFTRELTIPGGADERRRRHRGRRARVPPPPRPAHRASCAARSTTCAPRASPSRRCGRPRASSTAASATASPPATRPSRCGPPAARLHPDLPAPTGRTTLVEPRRRRPAHRAALRPRPARAPRAPRPHAGVVGPARRRPRAPPQRPQRDARRGPRGRRRDGRRLRALRASSRAGTTARTRRRRSREMVADGPAATAAMWSYLIGLDLTRSLDYWIAAPDTPFANLLQGPYRPRVDLGQNLWVRLVDVGAALAARTYAAPFEVVLRGRRRVLPVERRPPSPRVGRRDRGVRAHRRRGRPRADGDRPRRRVPRRHEPGGARRDRPRARAAPGHARARRDRVQGRARAVVPGDLLGG